ncbi:MAG: metal ABC transporter solute-binding protein, Zn/Mn family [Acidimicrobiales bacterium]
MSLGASGLAACSGAGASPTTTLRVVAAENQYGNVAAQIGGPYVDVTSVEDNPNTDPHAYELSPSVASAVSSAAVVIRNGAGYDDFVKRIESATPNPRRIDIDVQHLLGLPDTTPNPHLWYDPTTMPKMAAALASALARLEPSHAAYFAANVTSFDHSLARWTDAIASFRAAHLGTPVATTEPVADDLLTAIGVVNETPFSMQADVMNGTDPSPQDISLEQHLLDAKAVKAFIYNVQVTDPLTSSFVADARAAGVPVVGVYETMPVPGFDYQSWMMAELRAVDLAVTEGISTKRL